MSRRALLSLVCLVAFAGVALAAWMVRRGAGARAGGGPGFRIINVHEHIKSRKVAPRLLRAMDDLGIEKTVLCAGAKMTTHSPKKYGFEGWEENNQEVIDIAAKWPDRFVPFVTLRPGLEDAAQQLAAWVAKGARGLKLYSGHGSFHTLRLEDKTEREFALDDPSMIPVYAWAEREQLPIVWHVNTGKYLDEFRRVMDAYPKLRVNCPHHCMAVGRVELMRELLLRYPNLYMDLSHGYHAFMADALRRVSRDGEKMKKLYAEFPGRFLWGTDVVVTDHKKKTTEWISEMARSYFGLLGDAEFRLPVYKSDYTRERIETLPGLSLPRSLLRKIYEENPRRFLKR
ncbi:MAG: amidohydrolase family protein [Myxococcota bacterium]